MNEFISLLAESTAAQDRAMFIYRVGLTMIGVAILLVAYGVILANPKDPEKRLSPTVILTICGVVAVLGLGVIGYAWLLV